jgi:hypothetical protein
LLPEELARELGVSGKTIREWLRQEYPRTGETRYQRWQLSDTQVRAVRRRFETRRQRAESRDDMVVTTVALPARLHARLVRAARQESTVMTEIVRRAAVEWLKSRK